VAEVILVVDDDADVARFIEVNLRAAGYEVHVASDGEEALAKAVEIRPDLILLDVMMPMLDGYEVAQRLRRDARTNSCSIIMLTAKALSADKVLGLSSGADDYIIKPFDPVELLARVRGTLRRAREMRALSPLTGLPGNIRIQEEIRRLVGEEPQAFGVLYLDLDNFKAYNDHYGFVRGDRAIQATARLIAEVVNDLGAQNAFIGHVGGDDFVIIVPPHLAEPSAEALSKRFDEEVPRLYDPLDHERGYVEVEDRQGTLQRFPLLSVSIGGVTTDKRHFEHFGEVVEIASEMKLVAKRTPGSSCAFDRRST
jgi:diguanylate cyclase (GGDEF)-like protein